jgi:hypothetical protein
MLRTHADAVCNTTHLASFRELIERIRGWFFEDGPWWMCSFVFHLLLICSLALLGTQVITAVDPKEIVIEPPPPEKTVLPLIEIAPPEKPVLGEDDPDNPAKLDLTSPPPPETPGFSLVNVLQGVAGDSGRELSRGTPDGSDDPTAGNPFGPGNMVAIGPGPLSPIGGSFGPYDTTTKNRLGDRGLGPFGLRDPRARKSQINTEKERCVRRALQWLAKHQLPDGRWSLEAYKTRCKDAACTGPGDVRSDTAATALALLPFLGAGQTQNTRGPYMNNVRAGLYWLMHNQGSDGDLRGGYNMYAHGLATIALCEAYGMSRDKSIGAAAQRAVDFIQNAQNQKTGGWRYQPGEEGDTSVVGWQIMALKSAQMAKLNVDTAVIERAKLFLKSVSSSGSEGSFAGGRFGYTPGNGATPTMTSVGLLCCQYLGMPRNDPAMVDGTAYLLANAPEPSVRNLYYWYYATQVMHNQPGPEWDTWNRKIRRILIETQATEGCAAGSWAPQTPSPDPWGSRGGRLMMTSLSALTLEVYYRYLPLYTVDSDQQ